MTGDASTGHPGEIWQHLRQGEACKLNAFRLLSIGDDEQALQYLLATQRALLRATEALHERLAADFEARHGVRP